MHAKKSQVILCSSFSHQEQKHTINSAAHCRLIALLFHFFKVASGPHAKDLTFFQMNETELIQHAFGGSGSEYPKD